MSWRAETSIIAGAGSKIGLYASFSIVTISADVGGRPGMISAAPVVTAAPMVTLARDQLPQILLTVNTQLIILPYAAAVVAVGGPLESLMTASIVDASAAMTSRTVHGPVWCP